MSHSLASPLSLPCGSVVRNRLMKAAMTEGLANPAGQVTDELVRLYRTWSDGGAGILVTGNVMIDRRYLERPGNMVVDGNEPEAGLAALAAAGTAAGNHLWMQISHPGRQCTRLVNSKPVSASDVQLKIMGNFARPRALTEDEIGATVDSYARVAGVAKDAGFTGVQVHAAHGYLISQFLSPVTNRREDRWGGSLENRARFLLECVGAVRARVGAEFPLAVKLNSADFQKGAFSPQDCVRVALLLEAAGIDHLEISGGTYEQPQLLGLAGDRNTAERPQAEGTKRREAYFLDYTKTLRATVRVPLAVTGGFRSGQFMRSVLADDELDMIGLARPLCIEPDAPRRLLEDADAQLLAPEKSLHLGGGFFGPGSSAATMRALNSQGAVAWFYRQIIQLSKGEPLHENLSARVALWQHLRDEFRLGLARRRYLRSS